MNTEASPLISVVMATYAGDDFTHLREGIDSILGQTHTNLELLIVLDGPVNEEVDTYLTTLMNEDARVRVLRQSDNRGAACARNAGFSEAKGEYIAVFDADDVSLPNRLERQLAYLRETDSDLIGSFMSYIDDRGEIIGSKDMAISAENVTKTAILVNPINNPTAFAKASVFKENPYDERFRRGHDYHLYARLIQKGYRLANVPERLHMLRMGPDFMARRNGLHYFLLCLRCRLILLKMYPWYMKPPMLFLAIALSALRLLPGWCLRWVYLVRNRLRVDV